MTEHEKRYIIRHGIAPSKVFVTGMGIDPLEFDCVEKTIDPDRGRFKALVCFVGRLDPAKGIYELIEVVSKMKGICLKIVGEEVGEFRKHYDTLAPSLRERIQYLGCLPFNETASIIARSDIFCLPSRVESFGHVYLEAMYFGKPVIAWNLEAVKEVVADAGLFVASKTQLESAIRTLVEDENLRDDISYRGRAIVRDRFNWTRIAQIFAENALQS